MKNPMIDVERTFITSDHHFFSYKHPFLKRTTREEDYRHMDIWNQVVGKDDLVLYVGDFCDSFRVIDLMDLHNRLNGRKILIKGNHEAAGIMNGDIDDDVYRLMFEDVLDEMFVPELNLKLVHEPGVGKIPPGGRMIFGHEHFPSPSHPTVSAMAFCCCAIRHEWKPVRLPDALNAMEACVV